MTASHPDAAIRRRAALVSLLVGCLMLGWKWVAFAYTGSQAILSDALESIVHVVAIGFAYLSIRLNERPPDPNYPYGYGKIGYFSAGFEGGLIALAALAIFYEAGRGFLSGARPGRLGFGFAMILAASVANLALGLWLVRLGRRTKTLILEADGHHVLTDSYTSFGVVLGVALVGITGIWWLDPLVAILVGLNILRTGAQLVREAITGLMDRADPELLSSIVQTLQAVRPEGWIDVHNLRAWRAGDRVYVDFHLVVPQTWTVVELHRSHDLARRALRDAEGPMTDVIIHFDPEESGQFPTGPDCEFSVDEAVRVPARAADSASSPS